MDVLVLREHVGPLGVELELLVAGHIADQLAQHNPICQGGDQRGVVVRVDVAPIMRINPRTQLALQARERHAGSGVAEVVW